MRAIRETWKMLGRSIFVGERYTKNVKSIAVMSLIVSVAGLIMFIVNIAAEAYLVSLTSIAFMLMGITACCLAAVSRNRRASVIVTLIAVISVLTYNVLFISNGFAFLWTILVPLAMSYLISVRSGILVSFYFLLLYTVLFYTPLRSLVEGNYPEIIMNRFPILYFFHFFTTSYVMIQYHKSVLDQIDKTQQLEKAKEEADRANSAKSDFLAEMSHEIRTPINTVLGMNEMILRESALGEEETDRKAQEDSFRNISAYAGNIASAGSSLLSTINDILDFSKIEAGRLEIVESSYELNCLLSDISSMVSLRAGEKGLEYLTDVDPSLPNILRGDEIRIRQVLTNLLSNALKYTDKGTILLQVRSREKAFRAGDTLTLEITVTDTGVGIRKEDIPKLFSKFQRLDLDRNSTVEGTGLGLAITRRLLTLMGGNVNAESEYGKGSAFTVTLPQRILSCEPVGSIQKAGGSSRGSKVYHASFRAPDARILVVDDTRMNIAVVAGLLKATAVQIDSAMSGEEALGLLKANAYDLILMDQRMPVMDGTETLRLLREAGSGPNLNTPAVCLTADAIIGAKEKYISEGFTDYLSKPVSGEALEKMLIRHLPEGKVELLRAQEKPPADGQQTAETDWHDLLRETEIRPETGLLYCRQDGALYGSLLREFASGAKEKAQVLQAAFEALDWKQYRIHVHALKSTSRTIGAETFSDEAAELEKAAGVNDENFIRAHHAGMLDHLRLLAGQAELAADAAGSEAGPSGIVLEFSPEE